MTYGYMNFNRPVHQGWPQLVTPPVAECVTLAQAKNQCRVDSDITEDDDLISALIVAARQFAEVDQRRALLTSTWTVNFDNFPIWTNTSFFVPPEMRLPLPPLQSVGYVQYYDTNGDLQTLDPSLYYVDTASQPGRLQPINGQPWPYIVWTRPNNVQVQFTAGYTTPKQTTIQAMLLLIGGWYAQRESLTPQSLSELPYGASNAIDVLLSLDRWGSYV